MPMEARLVGELPEGPGWQFEPKWDGFRALAGRRRGIVELSSKSGKSLARFFPEVVEVLAATASDDYLVDGELVLSLDGVLSFDALQQRLHPAESRIARLARETPAQLMLFDCLRFDGRDLLAVPLERRRAMLEAFHAREGNGTLLLSPASGSRKQALDWLARSGGALDGIVAKRRDAPYRPGERAMFKLKPQRSADCVVGGFRPVEGGQGVASLLLGLYDEEGLLDHVGFTSAFAAADRPALLDRLRPYIGGTGFSGKAPGGPSRWRKAGESEWVRLAPELVIEVGYDQVTGRRFRHGTRFLRWRPDKAPRQCTMEQLASPLGQVELEQLLSEG